MVQDGKRRYNLNFFKESSLLGGRPYIIIKLDIYLMGWRLHSWSVLDFIRNTLVSSFTKLNPACKRICNNGLIPGNLVSLFC
jgi:hypothetical protein